MSWTLTGNREGLGLHLSELGNVSLSGRGQHEARPVGRGPLRELDDPDLLNRINAAPCAWTMVGTGASGIELDAGGDGLLEKVREDPSAVHCAITFYTSPDLVGFTFALPDHRLAASRHLMELVLTQEALEYIMGIDFSNFGNPSASTETPTIKEFARGQTYFSNELGLTVRPAS